MFGESSEGFKKNLYIFLLNPYNRSILYYYNHDSKI